MPPRMSVVPMVAACCAVVWLAVTAAPQPYAGDLLQCTAGRAANPHVYGGLWRVSPNGALSTIVLGKPVSDLVMANDNQRIVAACPDGVKLMQPMSGAWISTLWGSAPLLAAQSLAPLHTGDYAVGVNDGANPVRIFVLKADGSGLTTLYTGPATLEWHTQEQDLADGRIVNGSLSQGLVSISLASGAVSSIASPAVNSFAQDPLDGSWVIAGPTGLHRLDRAGRLTTLRPTGAYAQPVFDRAAGRGVIVTGTGGAVLRLDRQGNVVASYPNAYPGAKCDFLAGRNLVTRRLSPGTNRWGFQLDFPGEGGRSYQLGLSLSGFHPGIPLGGRTIPLVPDALFGLSVSGLLGPLFAGGSGRLDTAGRAGATLDLSSFGVAVRGLRIWAATITLDPGAPSGIATVSRPAILVLD